MAHFAQFLSDLFETGHVRVPMQGHAEVEFASARAQALLLGREKVVRLEFAGTAPVFDLETGLLGARLLYLGSQLFVDRSQRIEPFVEWCEVARACDRAEPSAVYSMDIALCFLPDLYRNAAQLAEDDPLTEALRRLALDWLFSSVGIAGLDPAAGNHGWMADPSLAQAYIDRILAYDDPSRLHDPEMALRIRQTLGAYSHELAGPNVLAALESFSLNRL